SRLVADVVLRGASSPPEHLVGRRIASMIGAPYASVNYLPAVPTVERLAQHQWIRWAAPWQGLSVERWISANVSPSHVLATVDSVRTLTELVAQGLGVGFLPCFSADIDPRVVRVGDRVDLGASIWLLTHDELRKTGRIAAFMRCAGEALLQSRPEIEGPFPDDKTAKAPI
ncbi:MAG: DNA-binding transcriptional LysR family regulator, partial [Kiritimatiellia bacterium]